MADARRIVLNGAVSPKSRDVKVDLREGPNQTFRLKSRDIERRSLHVLGDHALDLLEITAAVFCADSSIPRGGSTGRHMASGWRRRLNFQCAVRDPRFWSGADIRGALTEAVRFAGDDEPAFEFHQGVRPALAMDYLPFDAEADAALRADEVILFSGGLDSLAGVVERLETSDARIALVTHRSSPKVWGRQKAMFKALSEHRPGRLAWFPVSVTRVGSEASEDTQRTRSLLFVALAFAVARQCGADNLTFFENGVISANLPIGPQVIGTRATRTTHPKTLQLFQRLLDLVPGPHVEIRNPFAWQTKTEVVKKLRKHGCERMINESISCTNVYKRSKEHTHCGKCTQCFDRRFAILAAGLEDHDDASKYEIEVLTGPRTGDRASVIGLEWPRTALELADLGLIPFLQRFTGELATLAEGFGDLEPQDALARLHDLHRCHGAAVRHGLERGAAIAAASAVVSGELPATSTLAVLMGRNGPAWAGHLPRRTRIDPSMGPPAPHGDFDLLPPHLSVMHDGDGSVVDVLGLATLSGGQAAVVLALRPEFDEDVAAGRRRDQHRAVPASDIADRTEESESAIWQHVKRCRDRLARAYAEVVGLPPDDPHVLIKTGRPGGYLLDPAARFVK